MIKEYCEEANICVIRSNRYGSNLEKFMEFFAEAKIDFPELTPDNVTIVHYAGESYAHTFGIEFSANKSNVPNSYTRIHQLEYHY